MKKLIAIFICLILWPALAYGRSYCVSGKYKAIVVPNAPSHLSESRGSSTVLNENGTCYISLKTNSTAQEWEVSQTSLIHRELDTLSGRVLDEDEATRFGDKYVIECAPDNCEKEDADAYWVVFSQPAQGINPYAIVLLYYGHLVKGDTSSQIGLINRFVLPATE